MHPGWRRNARAGGWVMIGLAVLLPSVWVVVQAATARSSDELGLWAGWANILALPVAALGTAIVVFDRARARPDPPPTGGGAAVPGGGLPWMSRHVESVVERTDLMNLLRTHLLAADQATIGITGVYGAGGFGKTTLAAAASELPELRDRFPGGLLWVTVGQSLAGPALAQAVNDVVEQLTGERPSLATPDQAGYRLGAELAARPPTLLIVDDVWTAEQLRPFVQGGPPCTRLITTRMPALLPPSAHRVEVDEMSRVEAATLLTRGIPDLPATATTALLAVTGRWPLLTALVNGVLRRRLERGEPVEEAVAAVVRQLTVDGPTVLDVSVTTERERAVDLTVRAGLDLLPAPARERFAELGIFPEDVVVPDALTDLLWARTSPANPASETLRAALSDLSLVQRRPDGLVLHDVLRTYLRHRLGTAELRRVNAELVEAARGLVDGAAPDARVFPWWRLPIGQRYLWRHLCHHLDEAALHVELAATATSLDHVAAKIQILGVAAVEDDLGRVPGEYGVTLRARLSTSAHLLGPTTPATSFPWLLAARLDGIPLLAGAVRAYVAALPPGPHLTLAWPLPDLSPASLDRVIVGGLGWLQTCDVSRSGDWIAAGGQSGVIGMWERSTGLVLAQLAGHAGPVTTVRITPDAAWVVSAGEDGTVRVWDAARRRPVRTLRLSASPISHCAVGPDSTTVAAIGKDDTLQVVDIPTGRRLLSVPTGDDPIEGGCTFLDARTVLTVSLHGRVTTYDVPTGTRTEVLAPPAGVVAQAMVVARDGSWIATTGTDDDIHVHLLRPGGSDPLVLAGHDGFVNTFVANGHRLVSGGADGTIRVWDLATGTAVSVVQAHSSWVTCCALTDDRQWLISSGSDGALRVWRFSALQSETVEGHVDWVNALTVTPDGTEIVTGGNDDTIRSWSAGDGRPTGIWSAPGQVWSCAASRDRDQIATVTIRDTYLLRRDADGWSGTVVDHHCTAAHHCSLSPDGRLLAVGGLNGGVAVVSTTDQHDTRLHVGQEGSVRATLFLGDGASLLFGGSSGELRRWAFRTESPPVPVASGSRPVNALKPFAGRSRAACFTGSALFVLDGRSGDLVETITLAGADGTVNDGAISSDAHWIATAGDDGSLRVYEFGTRDLVAAMRVDGALFACAWRPNTHTVFAAGRNGVYAFEFHPAPPVTG